MKLSLETMSDLDLSRLIAAAMLEWAKRQESGTKLAASAADAGGTSEAEPHRLPETEPDPEEKDHCLFIAARLRRGEYIKAAERARVAEIALAHPEWVKRQGLPVSKSNSDWETMRNRNRSGRARER